MNTDIESIERQLSSFWHWTDVAVETRNLWKHHFGQELREDGLAMAIIDGACERSYYGALDAVAAAIGAKPDDLTKAIAMWSERQIKQDRLAGGV